MKLKEHNLITYVVVWLETFNFIFSICNNFKKFWIKLSFLYAYSCKISHDD